MNFSKRQTIFWQGPGAMLIAAMLFTLMGVCVKLGASTVPAAEMAFVRFLFGIAVVWGLSRVGYAELTTNNKRILILRGVFGGAAILLFYLAIGHGKLTNATVLNSTYPIFTTLFAAYFLRERISLVLLLPLVASIIGVTLLTHPDFDRLHMGDLFAIGSAVFAGASIVTIRELRKTESAWSIFFYFSLIGAFFSGVVSLPNFVLPSWRDTFYMFMAALLATVGQLIMTWAYKNVSASVGSVLTMTSAVFSAVLAALFFAEILSLSEGFGAFLVLLGSGFLAAYTPGKIKSGRMMEE